MSKYFVTCARGVEEITEGELRELGIKQTERVNGGVFFEGDQDALYRAHLWLRTGNRILLILRSFPVKTPDELYENIMKFKWETFLTEGLTFAVDCTISGRNTIQLNHSHFARLRAKDAIVDRMRDKTGARPDVNAEDPDISVVRYIRDGVCTLNMDATGAPLHERGYRARNAAAPLKETLAAAILKLAGWRPDQPLVDPMCGSGTLVAEGALIAANVAPGALRAKYLFMNWPDFHEPRWKALVAEAEEKRRELAPGQFFAFDHDPEAVRQTKQAFKILGLSAALHCEQRRFGDFQLPEVTTPGWIVMNPPYGDRLGEEEKLRPLYKAIGDTFKQKCQGWNGAVFTGSAELMKEIGLKTKRKIPLWNGPIECRLLTYEMYAGRRLRPDEIAAEKFAAVTAVEGNLTDLEVAVLDPARRTIHSINKMEALFSEQGRDPEVSLEEFAAFSLLAMREAGLIEIYPDFSGKAPFSAATVESAMSEWVDEGFDGDLKFGILATERGLALYAKREAEALAAQEKEAAEKKKKR
ncbi:MAG: THUMP domain-containing class I SAM-dependent RNA methyltransferase [Bdellovibrionota bacterium]